MITEEMLRSIRDYVAQFVTPILVYNNADEKKIIGNGTGAYIEINGNKYVITNDHVAKYVEHSLLGFCYNGNNGIFHFPCNFASTGKPIDVAMAKCDAVWRQTKQNAKCVPENILKNFSDRIAGEFYYVSGFPGDKRLSNGGQLVCEPTNLLAMVNENVENVESTDFALCYDPNKYCSLLKPESLSDPHGMSGSLVWNTRIIQSEKNQEEWTIDKVCVVGIVKQWWAKDNVIIATKLENMRLQDLTNFLNPIEWVEAYIV